MPNNLSLRLNVNERFIVIPKEVGRYHSFPTLIQVDDRFWLACRSGKKDRTQPHGFEGTVRLFITNVRYPLWWEDCGTFFGPEESGSANELDAILSRPSENYIFLATRDYEQRKKNIPFISRWDADELIKSSSGVLHPDRKPVKRISDFQSAGAEPMHKTVPDKVMMSACFGHIRQTLSGEFLMPGYGVIRGDKMPSPVLLSSDDGESWRLRSVLARSDQENRMLTEFSLGHIGDEKWLALIRNEIRPYHLMYVQSDDDGRTWSSIVPTPLKGHAPMIIKTGFGGFLVQYRDLSGKLPGIGIGISSDDGKTWKQVGRPSTYQGSIYDGGYGDIIGMSQNRFMIVYYLCDKDGSPWIEGVLFSLK